MAGLLQLSITQTRSKAIIHVSERKPVKCANILELIHAKRVFFWYQVNKAVSKPKLVTKFFKKSSLLCGVQWSCVICPYTDAEMSDCFARGLFKVLDIILNMVYSNLLRSCETKFFCFFANNVCSGEQKMALKTLLFSFPSRQKSVPNQSSGIFSHWGNQP